MVAVGLILRPDTLEDEEVVRRAHEERAAHGFEFLSGHDAARPWLDYLRVIDDDAAGRNLPEDRVATALLSAEVDGEIVGRISIRFALNDFLLARGGHLGYAVRPNFRRRGHAREILRQGVILLNARGVEPVLVTCGNTNFTSTVVIERRGGRLESRHVENGTRIRRYWISRDA